jgi:tetratricopeptide (TPR) repeat protein
MNSGQREQSETTARNAPCPCGSGRKFKSCCGAPRPAARGQSGGLDLQRASAPAHAIGPVTDAGKFLESFSPLQAALRQSQRQSATQQTRGAPGTTGQSGRSAQSYLEEATRLEAAGRQSEAIAALLKAVRLAPDNPRAHYNLGVGCLKGSRTREAISSLRQAISLKADFGPAHFHLGVALQDQGHDEDAMDAFRKAIALGANQREAHARLGDLLVARGDTAGAADAYRRAAGPSATGRMYAARALMAEEKYDAAEVSIRQALALDRNNGEAEWVLGNLLVIQGRFDEAVPHLDQAIELAPHAVGAYTSRITAKRLTEADRPLIERMVSLLNTTPFADIFRMKLEYALGKGFDDLGDYETAIGHFDKANRLAGRLSSYEHKRQTAWMDMLVDRYTPDYFARHAHLGVADETPIFIVGMPRSGTTLVEQIVSCHPLVAGGGELRFWPKRGEDWELNGAHKLDAATVQGLADDYLAELRRIAPEAVRVTDKLPHNFMWIGLIHSVFPRARFIHCRRDPVDTCLSIYFTQFLTRMQFANDRSDLVHEYRQYERIMAHWRTVLPADLLLDVDYETLVADREAGTRRLIAFCGLDWDAACLRPEDNRRIVGTASVWQARQPVYRRSVERWRNYEPWLGELAALHAGAG